MKKLVFLCILSLFSLAFAENKTSLTVLSEGIEPRRVISYRSQIGLKQSAELTMEMHMGMTMEGTDFPKQSFDTPLPTVIMSLTAEIIDIEDGITTASFGYGDVKLEKGGDPELYKAMETTMQSLTKVKGSTSYDSRGNVIDFSVEIPDDMPAELMQYLEQTKDLISQMMFPLPDVPLGLGASWQVVQPITNQGMTITQKTTYTIMEMDETFITFYTDLQQSAAPQKLDVPDLPPTATIELESFTGHGRGRVTISLDSLFPTSSKSSGESDMTMLITAPEGELTQTLNMNIDMSLSSQ